MIDDNRLTELNEHDVDPTRAYVLYWMQAAQRVADNAALHHAALEAKRLDVPLLVCIAMQEDYPDSNERHFAFMLEGFAEVEASLRDRGVRLVSRRGDPVETVGEWARSAALVVTDKAYLQPLRSWRRSLAQRIDVRLVEVETETVVPVEVASDKAEYAARTIRPKLAEHRESCHRVFDTAAPERSSLELDVTSDLDFSDVDACLAALDIDRSIGRVDRFIGGLSNARTQLTRFLRGSLEGYAERRADPAERSTSELSPWLHFGQIGVNEVVDKVRSASSGSDEDKDAFLEELIVRRELAINFVYYNDRYESFEALPDWARKTLAEHRDDERPHRYTAKELEAADTHDPYWNAAMREMRSTGYMHNALRMYWGKKVLEWCNTPEYAHRTLLDLNNRYLLDGRDANSWANVGWVFGLHDQAWQEREVYGKVRYMNANGLERKFDIQAYVDWVDEITGTD